MNKQKEVIMPKISVSAFADEAAESIINGNLSNVIEQLDALPKKNKDWRRWQSFVIVSG